VTSGEIILAIGVGAWTATNVVFTAIKMINERRDAIILGYLDKQPLTPEHKRLLLYTDWLPMWLGLAALMIVGSIALVTLPKWIVETGLVPTVHSFIETASIVTGILALLATAYALLGSIREFRMMKDALDKVSPPIVEASAAAPSAPA
jgi:hypothetical protein